MIDFDFMSAYHIIVNHGLNAFLFNKQNILSYNLLPKKKKLGQKSFVKSLQEHIVTTAIFYALNILIE